MVGERRLAAGAVRRHAIVLVDEAGLPEGAEYPPTALDVAVRVRDVGLVHVDPEGDALRHLPPLLDIAEHGVAAAAVELLDAELLDAGLGAELQLALHLQLDRQTVRVPAALAAHPEPAHRLVAVDDILEGARQHVVDAGASVRRGRPLVEHERALVGALLDAAPEDVARLPEGERALLQLRKIDLARHRLKHHGLHSHRARRAFAERKKTPAPLRDGRWSAVPPCFLPRGGDARIGARTRIGELPLPLITVGAPAVPTGVRLRRTVRPAAPEGCAPGVRGVRFHHAGLAGPPLSLGGRVHAAPSSLYRRSIASVASGRRSGKRGRRAFDFRYTPSIMHGGSPDPSMGRTSPAHQGPSPKPVQRSPPRRAAFDDKDNASGLSRFTRRSRLPHRGARLPRTEPVEVGRRRRPPRHAVEPPRAVRPVDQDPRFAGLGRARMAEGIRRRRPDRHGAVRLQRGDGPRPRAPRRRHRHHDGRADAHRARLRRAEGGAPAGHPLRRGDVVSALQRAGRRLRPRVAADARHEGRRRLRRQRPEDLDIGRAHGAARASCWPAPTRTRRSTRASATSCST